MANKTVLDFPEITTMADEDKLYGIQGTGSERDKQIRKDNFLKEDRLRITANEDALVPLAQNIISITDNYSHEISADVYEQVIECSGIVADKKTLTISQGTSAGLLNKVKLVNNTDFIVIVDDGVKVFWCEANSTTSFWYDDTVLKRNPGWGLLYQDFTNTSNSVAEGLLIESIEDKTEYKVEHFNTNYYATIVYVGLRTVEGKGACHTTAGVLGSVRWVPGSNIFSVSDTGRDVYTIWKLYK